MKISIIAGTRPEVVKLAPVHGALQSDPDMKPEWIATGQHGALADQAMHVFGIHPDVRLDLKWNGSALTSLTSALIADLGARFDASRPDFVLVQGDTASVFAGAMAAYLNDIPFGHVEAGLRSGDLRHPFPEEGFRRLVAPIADLNFAPTRSAARNLAADGIAAEKVNVTGNTVVDAVKMVASMGVVPAVLKNIPAGRRLVLVTLHRRENWDDGVTGVCEAIKTLRDRYDDLHFILPVHLNPRVKGPIESALSGEDRVSIVEPMSYPAIVAVMKRSYFILSDSGGIQEEAPSFGVPVLVLRKNTERQEAIRAGAAKLVGTNPAAIISAAGMLMDNPRLYARMSQAGNPFGDGQASGRIVKAVRKFLDMPAFPVVPGARPFIQSDPGLSTALAGT